MSHNIKQTTNKEKNMYISDQSTGCEKVHSPIPFMKWAGGKRQLLDVIRQLCPADFDTYCEPFVGGGAVFFDLQPEKAYINDINKALIRVYEVIRDDVDALIRELKKYQDTKEEYYRIRNLDRDSKAYNKLTKVQKAARTIYLNRTCFNGLYRVNSSNQFNVPYCDHPHPDIIRENVLRADSEYLNRADITFSSGDYKSVLDRLPDSSETFVYLDPPYDILSDDSFVSYSKDGFTREDQTELKKACNELDSRGIRFMLSNSSTDFILDLYKDYNITFVDASRMINSNGKGRGKIQEVLVKNY